MTADPQERVFKIYQEVQLLDQTETVVPKQQLDDLSNNWQNDDIPVLQRKVVDIQLHNLRNGYADPVFVALHEAMGTIELSTFSLLDAACATGYYAEVIKTLDKRAIEYKGCDYSEAMIKTARAYYPEIDFQVQDLTQLTYLDRSIDIVLVAGVLEHIPNYKRAIAEACRVAKSYLIIHRCPLIEKSEHIYTIGSQYNINTSRIYFSKKKLIDELQPHGFSLIKQVDILYNQIIWLHRVKSFIKRIILPLRVNSKNSAPASKVQTLVFRRDS